jgi:predicted Zn-dependent protease
MLLELLSVENPPNPNEVAAYLEETLKNHPGQASVILALGVANWQLGDIDGARRHLEKALELRPKDRRFRTVVADFYLDEGLPQKAQSLLDEQPVDDPNDGYWAVRSRLAERNGKYLDAATYIDRALATSINVRRYVYNKARLMQRLGNADEAEALHAEAARRSKTSQELLAVAIRLSTEQPTAEDCRHIAEQYQLAGRPRIAAAWRSIVARME